MYVFYFIVLMIIISLTIGYLIGVRHSTEVKQKTKQKPKSTEYKKQTIIAEVISYHDNVLKVSDPDSVLFTFKDDLGLYSHLKPGQIGTFTYSGGTLDSVHFD